MGLTSVQQQLIKYVAENNIREAKKCAISCLEEDTTAKNKWFVNKYNNILKSSGANMLEMPYDLQGFLYCEDVANSFNEGRYYLSDREKEIFDEIVRMDKKSMKLMELGIPYVNSTLLYGPSGTGKTTFGRYLAYKLNVPFCYMNFTNAVDSYMGNTSKNLRKAFDYAKGNPCVFMLDEIDCIALKRKGGSDGPGGEMSRIVISLMQEFDLLTNDVIILGGTNRMDRMDDALLDRFSVKHEVIKFNKEEKIEMIKRFLSDIPVSFSEDEISEIADRDESLRNIKKELIRRIAEKIEV